ncbi:DUF2510 domain-containing protein [Streptomyces sp. AK02-01A]|uniref:DUF2510 domain-containing protein n=1 Tax=Streptomyces sp. AK02-01A TaxID=3028648 RepID=UPI0029AAFF97|nr:DUF2510 domain-containing protein [Streptomyces sp. AK02-01A]MDX3850074.1 DUF2510 domain-containing protein [Streptomyces sp. AK02-01A]
MTYTTPPGWYPDPGHSGDGPRQERWWDGSAWTDEVRAGSAPAWGQPAAPPLPVGAPPYPMAPPPGARGRGRRTAVGITAVVVVLAIAGGFYLLGRGSDDNSAAGRDATVPSAAPSRPGPQNPEPDGPRRPGDGESGAPRQPGTEDGYATDAASGISIPVPDGWTGESGPIGAGVTTGNYACPGDPSEICVRGGVFSSPAAVLKIGGASAKASAEKDIEANAKESYGGKIYGEISSHQQLKSEAVTVAGQKGYLVRWKVVTSKGDDGYVQSLAFPSPTSPDMLVIVRSGFDVNDKAPKLSVMDDITRGIKAAAGTGSGQGV